jgi:hypothetical protein
MTTTEIKQAIRELFSEQLQYDETLEAVMRRNQLRKLLLDFAKQEGSDE